MKMKTLNAYVLHVLMYMVRHQTQLPVTVQAVSRAERIPYRRLSALFRRLTEAGIAKAAEDGRYVFARSPREITLLEVFERIEGGPIFRECFMNHGNCRAAAEHCKIHAAWGHPEHYF